eukprot:TRINITY_DN45093_c0_g1_i1.p1 TRINITY_DN45093_c0_g1~~TRINITY_DN45093_c0_g1_i1.p1  ORF type:complete len:287 (-),score=56.15 TRINITY_DN45093_c0_g1_i1:23-841(-)
MAAAMEMLLPDLKGEFDNSFGPKKKNYATDLKAPSEQEWAEVLLEDQDEQTDSAPSGRGQVRQITVEVQQDPDDVSLFRVDGKDKSWFLQKGAISFNRASPNRFRIEVSFQSGPTSRFGDDYAELSRAEQNASINWLLMLGVARSDNELTGYRDCKTSGFYFLFHLNFRRTHWRIIGSPHTAELEDTNGKLYTCNPQDDEQLEIPAFEGQKLSVEYAEGELWVLNGENRVARGIWVTENDSEVVEEGKLPSGDYYPTVLTSNCPSAFHARVV